MTLNFDKTVKLIFLMTMALTLVFSGFSSSVSAQDNTLVTPGIEEAISNFEDTTSSVSSDLESNLVKATKKQLNKELRGLKTKDLDSENVKALSLDNGNFFVQYVVSESSNFEAISSVSFVLDSDLKIISVYEINLKHIDEENASLQVWSEGNKTIDQTLVKPDVQPQWSWSKFKKCMTNDLGISWATASTIGVICGGACVITAGAGCIACLSGAAAISGFNWGYCIAKAQS
ncbi:hypothetical protein [Exiguobacterium sp. s189]|uniref:hypothetical protein n=1 Tax=Exiguobacterium sp. s189 TaxID=2751263 RepID=UPI001BE5652D|nr:hypothetical protein [Exiguobacterium sp. s189]